MRRIPGYGASPASTRSTRLGGLTNRVYRVRAGGEPLVLRIPGEGTEAYIDREVEAVNARAAAAAGVSPEVLHVDPARGLMLTRHVEGRTMTPALFRSVPGAPARAAAAFRQLHDSGARFAFRFELFAMIDDYLKVLAELNADAARGLLRRAGARRGRCARRSTRIRPRWRPATATRSARTSSIPASGCGSSTGSTRA